jgi:hypothetical protein
MDGMLWDVTYNAILLGNAMLLDAFHVLFSCVAPAISPFTSGASIKSELEDRAIDA